MASYSLKSHIAFLLALGLDLFCQVLADYCGSDRYCHSPYKCCVTKQACCYDNDNNSYYTRGFRLHVWNMWYFWLVIIFILMTCFGGCGYYRRRRLAGIQQTLTTSATSPRRVCTNRQRRFNPQPGFYAYTGPAVDPCSDVHLPPPYTQVMQQPNLYPVNKVDLPPYPGPPGNKDVTHGFDLSEVSPPPYCEVSMPSTDETAGQAASRLDTALPTTMIVPVPVNQEQDNEGSNTGLPCPTQAAAMTS